MTSMDNTPDSPAKTPEGYTTQGGNFWTLITPEIWKVLHAVLQHEPVRKLVRTERDGAGPAGAGAGGEVVKGLRPALSRTSGINLSNTRARTRLKNQVGGA